MLRNISLLAILMAMFSLAYSQDSTAPEKKGPTISGSADVYFRYGFNNYKESPYNSYTSFTTSHNSFELGMASIKLEHSFGKAGVVADLGFGRRAEDFSYNDGEGDSDVGKNGFFSMAMIKQLYLTYSPSDKVKLTLGSFGTHIGYELVDAYLNRNYSMSYMFTNGPFFHTGVKAEFAVKSSGFMIGIANPTDYKYVPEGSNNKKSFIAQYSFAPGDFFKAYLNYAGGQGMDSSKSKQFDLVLTSKLAEKFSIGFNGTYNNTEMYLGNKTYDDNKNWWGSALYLNFDPSAHAGITLRGEY